MWVFRNVYNLDWLPENLSRVPMRCNWTVEKRWSVEPTHLRWCESINEYGFCIEVDCTARKNACTWAVSVSPDGTYAYSLLVDFCLAINGVKFLIERDLWENANVVLQEETIFCDKNDVVLQIFIIETLSNQNLGVQSPYRNFEIICSGQSIFIDTNYLSSLGGRLFEEWNEERRKGRTYVEILDMDSTELNCLISATAKFRQIVITRNNYDLLASIAFRYGIASVLRAIEAYLIDAESINPINKLEIAANYKLARLGDVVSRKLLSSGAAMDQLHNYLAECGNAIDQVHPDVLLSLNIYSDYVLI